MKYADTVVGAIALALGALAMAGVIASGAYGQAAGAEARGVHALTTVLAAAPELTR